MASAKLDWVGEVGWGLGKIDSGNNEVTDLDNSYPRVITALKVLLEFKDLPLLYGTIERGSLNISLSNNPVFLE